ncbi:DUF4397 domain-containing protein [Mucilaginibacter koreensis]
MSNRKFNLSYLFALPLVVLLINAFLVSCKKESNGGTIGSNVLLTINNLSPDAYPVQLWINNQRQNQTNTTTNLVGLQTYASYGYNAPSAYFGIRSSDGPLQLRSTRPGDSIFVTLDTTKLQSLKRYTLFLTGLLTDGTLGAILTLDSTATPALGRGKIRYVNGSLRLPIGSPSYDVYANGTKAFSNVGSLKVTDYVELPAGTYDFKFVYAGRNVNTNTNVLFAQTGVRVQDGRLYTLYSRGITGRTDTAALGAGVIVNK